MSLENNFVTDVTSLVVVKPDDQPKVTGFKKSSPGFSRSSGSVRSTLGYYSGSSGPRLASFPSGISGSMKFETSQIVTMMVIFLSYISCASSKI